MKGSFDKKIYTARLLLSDLWFLVSRSPGILGAARNPRISKAFVEKIMTVTTAVNGCVYCTWFHARQAVAAGISDQEVKSLLELQFQTHVSEDERMALLYAQHYAETDRRPDEEMSARLREAYGDRTSKHILLFIRMIYFGNLFGNTWDAVLSRMHGRPAPRSSVLFEAVFFLLSFWVMFPTMALMRWDRGRTVAGA